MRAILRALVVQAACNLLGVAHGVTYAMLALLPGSPPQATRHVLWWLVLVLCGSYVVVPTTLLLLTRPLVRALDALGRGEPVDADRLATARRSGLGLAVTCSRISMWVWLSAAATVPLAQRLAGLSIDLVTTVHAVLTVILVGGVASTFVYYAQERHARARILPVLFRDGQLGDVRGARTPSIGFKILLLVVITCVLPVLVLTVAALAGTATPVTILYVGGFFLATGALQAAFIAGSVTGPVQALAAQMRKVTRADLSACAPISSSDALGQLASGFNAMVEGLRRAEFVKDTFGRYVSRQVLDEILGGHVELGGELRRATVLFSDIRGFTSLSERLAPVDVVRFLNRYLDIMVDVVVEHEGTIDKFIGDAIMASFGVPLSRPDDALRAVRAGFVMTERLAAWNAERRAAGEVEIEIGVGVHSGEVVAGNIGSAKKMEYTVIGDTVNTASRIEQLNKRFGTRLLISAETHALVGEAVIARALEPVAVRGKAQPVQVYEVTGLRPGGAAARVG